MGEEDDSKKQHVIFGSAGMAAAGMMPGAKAKPKPEPTGVARDEEPEADLPEPSPDPGDDPASDDSAAPDTTTDTEAEAPEFEEPVAPAFDGLRAAVVGHTGAGDFGKGMDTLFQRLDGVRLFGLADLNEETMEDSQVHAGSPAGFHGLAEMLSETSPDVVSIASGSTALRFDHLKEALEAGCHVISEAPMARTLKECDEILGLLSSTGLKMAVRYPMRLDPHLRRFQAESEELIGELLEMRVWGECGDDAGGEDLLVNGIPLFDVVRWFGGEVSYCTAGIFKDGIAAIAEDAHESASRDLGPLLGDAIHAEFEMDSGIRVSFVSDQRYQSALGPSGIEFVGTRSRMRLMAGETITLSLLRNPAPGQATRTEVWQQWPKVEGNYHEPVDHLTGAGAATRRVVKDWIAAIENDIAPVANAVNAAKALEMAHGVWQAATTMKRAYFPLANRLHPLSEESQ